MKTNTKENWIVMYKDKVVIKFRMQNAARNFIGQNQDSYFHQLKLVKIKEEEDEWRKRKHKRIWLW